MFQACLFHEIQEQGVRLIPTKGHVMVADGNKAEIAGSCNPIVQVGSKKWKGKAILVKGLNYPAIVGIKLINDMGIIIDSKNRRLTISSSCSSDVAEVLQLFQVAALTVPRDEEDFPQAGQDMEAETPFLFTTTHSKVSPKQLEEFEAMLRNARVAFTKCTGLAKVPPMKIYYDQSVPPVKGRSFPLNPAMQKAACAELDKLLAKGLVRPSTSPWNSPIFLIPKKSGEWRFTEDFRGVNKVSRAVAYGIPFAQETLDQLRDAIFIGKLDLESGYHQVPLEESSIPLTAFSILGRGHYEWLVTPFGLSGAPAHFQDMMENVLAKLIRTGRVFVFLDDIIVMGKTFEEYTDLLKQVLDCLKEHNLKLNWKKCEFLCEYTEYLGFIVGQNTIQVAPSKIESVVNFPRPKTIKQLRGFLALLNFLRRFIPNLSDKTAPLNEMLKKDAKFLWTEERNTAFLSLKQCLVEPPVLSVPNFDLPFEIRTDASDYALGAVLLQHDGEGYRILAYHSRLFTPAERNYTTTEKECLAVISAAERWRGYIMGTEVVVKTDHSALTWLRNIKNPTGRLARWATRLSVFDKMKIVHLSGQKNLVADCLSRAFDLPDSEGGEQLCALFDTQDPWYNELRTKVQRDPKRYPNFLDKDNVLYKRVKRPDTKAIEWKVVVPTQERRQILNQYHDSLFGSHLGVKKTYHKIAQDYYWPKMAKECQKYVQTCVDCQRYKASNVKAAGVMTVKKTEEIRPNQIVTLDLMGPLPCTPNRSQFILVCVCAATKYLIAVPVKKATADNILKALQVHWVSFLGVPKILQTDNASQLISKKMQEYCAKMSIQLNHSPYYFPASNMCERYNRNIKTALAIFAKENHRNWDQHLPFIQFALNSAMSETTGYSPNKLMFGREIEQPFSADPALLNGSKSPFDPNAHVQQVDGELARIYAKAVEATNRAKKEQQKQYNLRHRPVVFSKGDLVWLQNFQKSNAADYLTAKLLPKYNGPYRIKDVLSRSQYELEDLNGKEHGRWNVTHLKPLNADTRL